MSESSKVKAGVYRHNKSGKLYEVIGQALQTESEEWLVIYKPLYASKYKLFARPTAMFTELVTVNGRQMPRFEPADAARSYLV